MAGSVPLVVEKIFNRLSMKVSQRTIEAVVRCKPDAIQSVLTALRERIERHVSSGRDTTPTSLSQSAMTSTAEQWRADTPSATSAALEMDVRAAMAIVDEAYYGAPAPAPPHPVTRTVDKLPPVVVPNSATKRQQVATSTTTAKRQSKAKQTNADRQERISELTETVGLLTMKIDRMERLLQLKDRRIADLSRLLEERP